jgi:hypothetical protein
MVGYGFFFVLELNMKDIFVELPKWWLFSESK